MKLSRLLLIFSLAVFATGCMDDDFSDCLYTGNMTLSFSFLDVTGEENFDSHIDIVDLFLFDENGRFAMHVPVSEQMLAEFQGVRMTVDPGTYYAMCWANVKDNSEFTSFVPGVTSFDECYLSVSSSADETGDRVYYAPHKDKPAARSASESETRTLGAKYDLYRIDVPQGESVTKDLRFVRAHRTVHVYIKNLDAAPKVSTRQLWNKYNFFFETQPTCCDFARTAAVEQIMGTDFHVVRFHSALGKFNSNMRVEILNNRGDKTLHTVNLLQFVTDNPPTDTDDIHILVEFLDDFGVKVTVPSWEGKPVGPGAL